MEIKIVVPALGESVVEATVARWMKKEGDSVDAGEALVELETDKVNLEVGAEKSGVLVRIERQSGEDVKVGDVLGVLGEAAAATGEKKEEIVEQPQPPVAEKKKQVMEPSPPPATGKVKATPSARRLAQEENIDLEQVAPSDGGKQISRQDVEKYLQAKKSPPPPEAPPVVTPAPQRAEERTRMSRRRRTIAQRLVEAQHTAAMLTTYNEIDMTAVMDLRKRRKESFQKRHGIALGIVSFFVKAAIGGLKEFPAINAEIQGEEIVIKHYYDIGIAIGASEGLVVPVLKDADQMTFPQVEKGIRDFIEKTENGTLSLEDLRGGTFTITNGGVFGSLLSTPILNPPQVGILGLHKIEDRPIAVNGQIVIRPMMYVALSYDHRIVDGRESVQFLARVKEMIEDPGFLLLEG